MTGLNTDADAGGKTNAAAAGDSCSKCVEALALTRPGTAGPCRAQGFVDESLTLSKFNV